MVAKAMPSFVENVRSVTLTSGAAFSPDAFSVAEFKISFIFIEAGLHLIRT